MSVVTAHMVYFCAFARSEIFHKNARKFGVGRRQFDAGVNGLKMVWKKVRLQLGKEIKVRYQWLSLQFMVCLSNSRQTQSLVVLTYLYTACLYEVLKPSLNHHAIYCKSSGTTTLNLFVDPARQNWLQMQQPSSLMTHNVYPVNLWQKENW